MSGAVALLTVVVLLSSCRTGPLQAGHTAVPEELLRTSYIFEVVRYLYHWHLDESDLDRLEGERQLLVWVRRLEPKLDPGDRSLEAEMMLPQLQLTTKVKKEDYAIPELGIIDKSSNFRVTRITRDQVPARAARDWATVRVDMQEVRAYLFRTRNQHDYPDQALVEHLRQALRKEASMPGVLTTNTVKGDQVVYLAPLSSVANDTWVFWEAGRKLFYIASDVDLANPAVWENEALLIRVFDLDEQVVGSHEEAPGSNRFLTRDQVGRALFNCVVLGQRIIVPF